MKTCLIKRQMRRRRHLMQHITATYDMSQEVRYGRAARIDTVKAFEGHQLTEVAQGFGRWKDH